jgi:hypothetical protein
VKKITDKSSSPGEPAVRQQRGPGMNRGLKKPRHGQFKEPEAATKRSRAMIAAEGGTSGSQRSDYKKAGSGSYLSGNLWGRS